MELIEGGKLGDLIKDRKNKGELFFKNLNY